MIHNTNAVLGIRCAKCGKLNYHGLSLFLFAGQKTLQLKCTCGANDVAISLSGKNKFTLQVNCALCDASHLYQHTLQELWNSEFMTLTCQETALEVAFWGQKSKVKSAWRKQEKTVLDMVEDIGFSDYFDNPDIMYQVLEHLNTLSEKGCLECQCGNTNIDLEILPDRLQLACGECGAQGLIFAENQRDLFSLKQLAKIQLSGQEFVLRSLEKPKKPKKQSKK